MATIYQIDGSHARLNNGDVGQVMAKRVRDWRRDHNAAGHVRAAHEPCMSQIELATRAGVGVGTIQGVEKALRRPRRQSLVALAHAMNLTVAQLQEGDSAEAPTVVQDPRGKDLRDEDYEIARLFHTATTDVKVSVRNQLRADAGGIPVGVPFPEALNRRTGHDRRAVAHEQNAAASPEDAENSAITALVGRIRSRLRDDPTFMQILDETLALFEERQTPPKAPSGRKAKLPPPRSA